MYSLVSCMPISKLNSRDRRCLEKAINIAEKSVFVSNLRLGAYIGKGKCGLCRGESA